MNHVITVRHCLLVLLAGMALSLSGVAFAVFDSGLLLAANHGMSSDDGVHQKERMDKEKPSMRQNNNMDEGNNGMRHKGG